MVVAPAGTPPEIVERLNKAAYKALADQNLAERLQALNVEASDPLTPAATKAFIEAEIVKWREVVALAGAKVD